MAGFQAIRYTFHSRPPDLTGAALFWTTTGAGVCNLGFIGRLIIDIIVFSGSLQATGTGYEAQPKGQGEDYL